MQKMVQSRSRIAGVRMQPRKNTFGMGLVVLISMAGAILPVSRNKVWILLKLKDMAFCAAEPTAELNMKICR